MICIAPSSPGCGACRSHSRGSRQRRCLCKARSSPPTRRYCQTPLPSIWRGLAILAAELAFKLSLVVLAGFIIKDVVLVGLLLVALATLQRSRSSERPVPWICLSLILLALSLFVRPSNFIILGVAAALLLPLALQRWHHYPAALAAACILFSLSLPLYSSFNRYVAKARPSHAEVQLFLFDSAGISARTGRDVFKDLPN